MKLIKQSRFSNILSDLYNLKHFKQLVVFLLSVLFSFQAHASIDTDRLTNIKSEHFYRPLSFQFDGEDYWYSFELKAYEGATVTIIPHTANGYLSIAFVDEDNNTIRSNSDHIHSWSDISSDRKAFINRIVATPTICYIRVSGTSSANGAGYDIQILPAWFNHDVKDSDRLRHFTHTYNSTLETAIYVKNGLHTLYTKGGSDSDYQYLDYFRFIGKRGGKVRFEMDPDEDMSSGYCYIYLQDINNRTIISGEYDHESKKYINEFVIAENSLYYLKVKGTKKGTYNLETTGITNLEEKDTDGDGLTDDKEYFYKLNPNTKDTDNDGISDLTELRYGTSPRTEIDYNTLDVSNQNISEAQNIPYYNKPFSVEYIGPRIFYWYKLDLFENEGITIVMDHLSSDNGMLKCQLYNADNEVVTSIDYVSEGDREFFDFVSNSSSSYYIKIYSTGTSGKFEIALYKAWFNNNVSDSDRSFHSSFNTSFTLTNMTKSLNFSYANEVNTTFYNNHIYRFNVPIDEDIYITVEPHLNYEISRRLELVIYNSEQERIRSGDYYTDYVDGNYVIGLKKAQFGKYYLKISADHGRTGYYKLSFGYGPPPIQSLYAKIAKYSEMFADPLDPATGAHIIDRTILGINGAIPISADLHYNSRSIKDSIVGFGWTHNYNMYLSVKEDESIEVLWFNGRITQYLPKNDGINYSNVDGDSTDVLIKNEDDSFMLTDKDLSIFNFNQDGKLIRITNRNGFEVFLNYESDKLDTVLEPISGRSLQYSYSENRLVSISALGAGQANLSYDKNGNLTTIADPLSNTISFTYNDNHQILSGINELGNTFFTNTYNSENKVVQQDDGIPSTPLVEIDYTTNSEGNLLVSYTNRIGDVTKYTIDSQYRMIQKENPLNDITTYEYDAYGNRISIMNDQGNITRFLYDNHCNLLEIQNPAGRSFRFEYDENNNIIKTIDPKGNRAIMAYNDKNNMVQYIDQSGGVTNFEYNEQGLLKRKIFPNGLYNEFEYVKGQVSTMKDSDGNIVKYNYSDAGRLTSLIDQSGNTTNMTYDLMGRLLSIKNPVNGIIEYNYDAAGYLISKKDANGNITKYEYNNSGKQVKTIDALGNVTTMQYDNEDRLQSIVDPNGNAIVTYTYDANGRVLTKKDALNNTTTFVYDNIGNIIKLSDPENNTTVLEYNALQQLVSISDPLGRVQNQEYDFIGNIIKHTDAMNQETNYAYDELSRLISVQFSNSNICKQAYNANGNISLIEDAGNNQTIFTYDINNRLINEKSANGNSISMTYNSRGLLSASTNARGEKTIYTYDEAGRLIRYNNSNEGTEYIYDNVNNLLQVSDSVGTIQRQYDALNRVIKYIDVFGNSIQYEYSNVNNLKKITYPDGKEVLYDYNAAGQLTQVTDWVSRHTKYGYDTNGRLNRIENSDGSVLTISYDTAGQLTHYKIVTKNNSVIYQIKYSYNLAGNITSVETSDDSIPNKSLRNMTYGAANQVSTYNGKTIKFDEDGNMIRGPLNGGFKDFTYDSQNRLIAAGDITYIYDAENRRVVINQNGVETRYIIDPQSVLSRVLMETDESGNPISYYVYGIGLIGRQDENGNYSTYHFDSLGSTIALTNESGQISDQYSYSPYGEIIRTKADKPNIFKFHGQHGVITVDNGLYYMRARYYSPYLCRFINKDILQGNIIEGITLNRYAFANGQPLNKVDPLGLSAYEQLKISYSVFKSFGISYFNTFIMDPGQKLGERINIVIDNYSSGEYGEGISSLFVAIADGFGHSTIEAGSGALNLFNPSIWLKANARSFSATFLGEEEGKEFTKQSDKVFDYGAVAWDVFKGGQQVIEIKNALKAALKNPISELKYVRQANNTFKKIIDKDMFKDLKNIKNLNDIYGGMSTTIYNVYESNLSTKKGFKGVVKPLFGSYYFY